MGVPNRKTPTAFAKGGTVSKESEFRSYNWIVSKLRAKGWNVNNPNTDSDGEVWTQNECLEDARIKKALGLKKPEYVIRVNGETVIAVEAKAGVDKLSLAIKEAQGYADAIQTDTSLSAPIAIGVAGDEKSGYAVSTWVKFSGFWEQVTAENRTLNEFPGREQIERLLANKNAEIYGHGISLREIVTLSNDINRILHVAKVEKESRAILVAALLLTLDNDPSYTPHKNPDVFLSDLNSRAALVFEAAGKREVWEQVKVRHAAEHKSDLSRALQQIIGHLREADILNLISKTDILGNFFENFLRYGNTSKDLGIVLTPRHICWLASEALCIDENDIVYDPAAGTGGFLISAFNRVASITTKSKLEHFANNNIFAVEASPKVASLAFVNMFFRGDGKHNLKIDSCFNWKISKNLKNGDVSFIKFESASEKAAKESEEHGKSKIEAGATKVLMNPPFSLKNDLQKETDFIDHGLDCLQDNGLLFCIIPSSVFYEKSFQFWRNTILMKNTLIASISLPADLFYPVSTETVAVIIKKGAPHQSKQDVLWARIKDDGFVKRKGYRVESSVGLMHELLDPLAQSLKGWTSLGVKLNETPGEIEFSPVVSSELIPAAHLGASEKLDPTRFEQATRKVLRNLYLEKLNQPKDECLDD